MDELCPGGGRLDDVSAAASEEDTKVNPEAAFLARFEAVGLRLALVVWILNADLMEKYPGSWNRFVSFLHLAEATWRPLSK